MVYLRVTATIVVVLAMLLAVRVCAEGGSSVTGTITFDGDPSIPAGAVLTVQLRDVSHQDASAKVIATQTIDGPERFPIDFAVPYEPGDIDDRATYGLNIRISLQDRLIYINDTAFDVLTRGNPSRGLDVWVIAVGGG